MDALLQIETPSPFRSPEIVMAPQRLGAMHQSRLSFVRSLIRKMSQGKWKVFLHRWDMSAQGFGVAIYRLETCHQRYHLVVFSEAITDEERSDRVIAEKWDTTFALVKGELNEVLLEQLRQNVPLQEAGRNTNRVLVLSRANKSVRIFEHLVESLSKGQQPDPQILANVGYILRTTAVYGNGKFGVADFEKLQENSDFNLSFSAQMCAVYLLRQFSLDWIHFMAQQRGKDQAVPLNRAFQRYLGVGNATGLGMAPYLINHPRVVDQWLSQREKALSKVASLAITLAQCATLKALLERAVQHLQQVTTIDEHQQQLNQQSIVEISAMITHIEQASQQPLQWKWLIDHNQQYSYETQEIAISCLLELSPESVDCHEVHMNADETLSLTPGITVGDLQHKLATRYRWALEIDFSKPENIHWFWYISEDKEEPRLGVRGKEHGDAQELPLDIARQVGKLNAQLSAIPSAQSLAEFLLQFPEYRTIARRVWTMSQCALGDIQMNVLGKEALPMYLLRCKLSMFGATKFDPRSDRWVRVTLFQGAPLLDEIHEDEWLFPILPELATEKPANVPADKANV